MTYAISLFSKVSSKSQLLCSVSCQFCAARSTPLSFCCAFEPLSSAGERTVAVLLWQTYYSCIRRDRWHTLVSTFSFQVSISLAAPRAIFSVSAETTELRNRDPETTQGFLFLTFFPIVFFHCSAFAPFLSFVVTEAAVAAVSCRSTSKRCFFEVEFAAACYECGLPFATGLWSAVRSGGKLVGGSVLATHWPTMLLWVACEMSTTASVGSDHDGAKCLEGYRHDMMLTTRFSL